MTTRAQLEWKQQLQRTARSPRTVAKVIGLPRIEYAQHALLVTTAILAFGNDPRATLYIDGLPAEGGLPRPDLILIHPEVGVLIIENKGIPLEAIVGLDDLVFRILRSGQLSEEDPYHQAERVMFKLKDLCKGRFDLSDALFLRTVAFPRVRRAELESRFGQVVPPETLFSDTCHDAAEFRMQVLAYATHSFHVTGKRHRLTQLAHDNIMTVLSGKALFHPPRLTRLDTADPKLLGVQIQDLELAMKDATAEQRDLGRADLRGSHRLFRGVAGSGKSVMLALSVAQTLVLNREDGETLFESGHRKRTLAVCFNRTLVHYLRSKIRDRFGRIAWDTPTDHELTVTHFEGLVRSLAAKSERLQTQLSYEQRELRAQALCERLDALSVVEREALGYDAIYVDEAQDLVPGEFEVLRRIALQDEDGGQTLVIFYDNAQNIYGVPAPTWDKLGINIVGRTVFLDNCLRNTREVLKFAFNVLVGSFAPEGQRVSTRQFADVASLKQRKLIDENDGVVEVHFSMRNGPTPKVDAYDDRPSEIKGIVRDIRRLILDERVLPSDILVLYKSHLQFRELPRQLARILPQRYELRHVDREHHANKDLPLLEEGYLTLSTIASAKGFDAPIVFVVGADEIAADARGRASFYVAATRAKLLLHVSGTRSHSKTGGLLPEILASAAHASAKMAASPTAIPVAGEPPPSLDAGMSAAAQSAHCRFCSSTKLHCQQGGNGYYLLCVECMQRTPLPRVCSRCKGRARIRARGRRFVRICRACGFTEQIHANQPLDEMER